MGMELSTKRPLSGWLLLARGSRIHDLEGVASTKWIMGGTKEKPTYKEVCGK